MAEYHFTVYFEPLDEGGYNVIVPAIPEICTFGSTRQEAREMAKDAIRCVIESALKHGEPIPQNIKPANVARATFSETFDFIEQIERQL